MILVTGAAGRLGRRVVQRLIEQGYDVLGTDRVPCDDSPSPFIQADLCNVNATLDEIEILTPATFNSKLKEEVTWRIPNGLALAYWL